MQANKIWSNHSFQNIVLCIALIELDGVMREVWGEKKKI
jgi:hypothetical protein